MLWGAYGHSPTECTVLGYGLEQTLSKADAFVAKGAQIAKTPRQAAKDADFVIEMVRDDNASQEV